MKRLLEIFLKIYWIKIKEILGGEVEEGVEEGGGMAEVEDKVIGGIFMVEEEVMEDRAVKEGIIEVDTIINRGIIISRDRSKAKEFSM